MLIKSKACFAMKQKEQNMVEYQMIILKNLRISFLMEEKKFLMLLKIKIKVSKDVSKQHSM